MVLIMILFYSRLGSRPSFIVSFILSMCVGDGGGELGWGDYWGFEFRA